MPPVSTERASVNPPDVMQFICIIDLNLEFYL